MKHRCIPASKFLCVHYRKPVHNICVPSLLEQKVLYRLLVLLMAHKPDNEQNLRKGQRSGSFFSLCFAAMILDEFQKKK